MGLKSLYDTWEMFQSTDMGDNLEEVVGTKNCKVLRMQTADGDGLMTIYRVFDGVYLMYNDFHMSHCYSRFHSDSSLFCIDHCREGRIEHRTDKDMHYYMEAGDLRLDCRGNHNGDMYFPVAHYHGITIGFALEYAEKSVREAMPGVSVDLAALADKFCGKDRIYILRKYPAIEHIFSELYNVPAKIRMDYFKIKIMELLIFLRALEVTGHKDERPYFYSSQIEKIKAVQKLLIENPETNYTTESLAKQFDLSVAALKNGFKGVYGSPIYTYIRTYKMNLAASMLVTDRKKRIIEVASAVGYDNPSKFAAAFKELFGMILMWSMLRFLMISAGL